jgi:hypothetical protein
MNLQTALILFAIIFFVFIFPALVNLLIMFIGKSWNKRNDRKP